MGTSRIVAVVNQKGGVGKTTTAVNLAAALAIAERPTLLVDADPQANSTRALGFDLDPERPNVYDAFNGLVTVDEVRLVCEDLEHLHVVPSDRNLVGVEVELVGQDAREYRLQRFLEAARSKYDHIIIDCPPSLGLLTLNALVAANGVLIPVQAEYLALEGMSQLMDTVDRIRAALNPDLEISGVVMTMFDERTNLAKQVVQEVRDVFGEQVYQTVVPRNVRLSEAPSHGKSIFLYDIRSKGAEAYLNLAEEFLKHEAKGIGARTAQPDPGGASTEGDAAADDGPAEGGAGTETGRGADPDRPGPDPA